MVSKTAVLLTEWVSESDLVSKTPHLLTEWVSESDLVRKMADLLTEKGAEYGRCYPHSVATIIGVRECYLHSYAVSKSRAGVSAGLGGFVGFRQLPRRPGECGRLAKIDWPSGNERPTGVTAVNLRSRRPDFLACARGVRATRAELGVKCEGPATREGFAGRSREGAEVVHIYQRSPVGAGDEGK